MQELNNMPERWCPTKEMCEYLGVSCDTLHTWINEKKMPASKAGPVLFCYTLDFIWFIILKAFPYGEAFVFSAYKTVQTIRHIPMCAHFERRSMFKARC